MVSPNKKLKKIFFISGITGAVYGGFRYLLPLVIPFLLAYATALWIRPSVRYFEKKLVFHARKREWHVPASVIGGMELLFFGALLSWIFYRGGKLLLSQLSMLSERLPIWIAELDRLLTAWCRKWEIAFGLRTNYLVEFVSDLLKGLAGTVRSSSVPVLMNNSASVVRALTGGLIFLIIYFVATLLCIREMESIRERKSNSTFHREFSMIGRRLVTVADAWLKTQIIIMSITAVLCTAGLFAIGNPYSILFGIGIGIFDALPIFGAGCVLVPWGLFFMIRGQWGRAVLMIGLYVICYLVRQMLEPRLMGDKVGLSALETLVSMYVGFELFGVVGFILGPIGLLLIEDLLSIYCTIE